MRVINLNTDGFIMQANFTDPTEQDALSSANLTETIDAELPVKSLNWAHLKRATKNGAATHEATHEEGLGALDAPVDLGGENSEATALPDAATNLDWGALRRAIHEDEEDETPVLSAHDSFDAPASSPPAADNSLLTEHILGMRETLELMRNEITAIRHEFETVRHETSELRQSVAELDTRGSAQEKVFDTLHQELQGYKNDFVHERFKPTVRALLFLCDSIEQFDGEVEQHARPQLDPHRRGISPHMVRENLAYFRHQLVEALHTCEVTPMEPPSGAFNPEQHKAFEFVAVDESHNNTVQQVLRSGWYLNGRVLRPAEVVVGRFEQPDSLAPTSLNSA